MVADSEDHPIVACPAKRLIELYGYFDPACSPTLLIKALGVLHEGMAKALRDKGYQSAEVFIPPSIEKSFGGRLMRGIRSPRFLWKWAKNWHSFTIKVLKYHELTNMGYSVQERFERFIEKVPDSPCWYWTGSTNKINGYGFFAPTNKGVA